MHPASLAQRSADDEDDQDAPGDEQAANGGVGGPAGLEHEGNGEDRCHVGDSDLSDHDQSVRAVELSFLQHRYHDRRRARRQQDGVHGNMGGSRQLGDDKKWLARQRTGGIDIPAASIGEQKGMRPAAAVAPKVPHVPVG